MSEEHGFHVTLAFTWEQVKDQLIAAVEGGSTYWAASVRAYDANASPAGKLYDVLDEGGYWVVKEQEWNGSIKPRHVNHDTLADALRILATKYPDHFKDIMLEQGDAYTGDAVLQCAVFGDLVYG